MRVIEIYNRKIMNNIFMFITVLMVDEAYAYRTSDSCVFCAPSSG